MAPDSTTPGGRSTIWYLLVLGPLTDALTTYLGVFRLGLPELGLVPRLVFSMLGPAGLVVLFLYELLLALVVYWALRGLLGPYAAIPAVAGPWITGLRNLGILLGLRVFYHG